MKTRSPSTLLHPPYRRFKRSIRRQLAQRREVINVVNYPPEGGCSIEFLQSSSSKLACGKQGFFEIVLGIRARFDAFVIRQSQWLFAIWVTCRLSNGNLIKTQPRFKHTHGHYGYCGHTNAM